jgi:hypothetical protein
VKRFDNTLKLILSIFFLTCTTAYGQYNPYGGEAINDVIRKGDSLEKKYQDYAMLNQINDTLPLFSNDESSGWRNMQVVTYFYDDQTLRKISFRNGQEGHYFFYFEEPYLRKIRIIRHAGLIDVQYYYTIEENKASNAQIKQWSQRYPEKVDMYELLNKSKEFLAKFKTFL